MNFGLILSYFVVYATFAPSIRKRRSSPLHWGIDGGRGSPHNRGPPQQLIPDPPVASLLLPLRLYIPRPARQSGKARASSKETQFVRPVLRILFAVLRYYCREEA
jgi:hypothetical protein